jgi:hypothetical protein
MSSNSGANAKASAGGEGANKDTTDGEASSERSAQAPMCLTSDEVNYLIFRYALSYR